MRGVLAGDYATATAEYSNVANRLLAPDADWDTLENEIEQAREQCERARKALLDHRKEHGC